MILRFIVTVVIIYLGYRLLKGLFLPMARPPDKFPRKAIKGEDLVEDPYCHTYVPLSDAYKAHIDGKVLYFCSKECCEKYRASVNINGNTKIKN
jgi:YHS domain-containing protein